MLLLENRKARQEYELLATYTAGVILLGGEVKSLRKRSGSFNGSYIKLIGGEAFLLNAQITPYAFANNTDYDPKRTRKLLLHARELADLVEKTQQKGHSLIPLRFELAGRHVKLVFAVARGKKQYERRAELKARAVERDIQRELKEKVRVR